MLQSDAPDFAHLRHDDDNTLLWNYLIEGPPGTLYEGGWYWGVLKLPENYPLAPPSILMMTPNGRFETNTRLCMSMSDFHPESWQPAWWLSSLMKGILSFMLDKELTTGAVMPAPPDEKKRELAATSLEWTRARPEVQNAFPDFDEIVEAARARRASEQATVAAAAEAAVALQAGEQLDAPAGETVVPCASAPSGNVAAASETAQGGGESAQGPGAVALEAEVCAQLASAAEVKADAKQLLAPDVDDDPRPMAVGDHVRVKIGDPAAMTPEERVYMGREGFIKKGTRPGYLRVLLVQQGDTGVNMYLKEEQLERLKHQGPPSGKVQAHSGETGDEEKGQHKPRGPDRSFDEPGRGHGPGPPTAAPTSRVPTRRGGG